MNIEIDAVKPLTFAMVSEIWHRLESSKSWPRMARAHQCLDMPECVQVGASEEDGYEVFAVLDVFEGRELSVDEFPDEWLQSLDWRDVPT